MGYIIQYAGESAESTEVQIVTPAGDIYGPFDVIDETALVAADGETFLLATGETEREDGLKPNTLYKLSPIPAEIEENVEFDEDEDDEEDEEEDGEAAEEV